MRRIGPCVLLVWVVCLRPVAAQPPPLLPEPVVAALASEISGELARRNLEFIATQHRMRASRGFHEAAQHIATQLRDYGLQRVEILRFPADGETMFGTQKSRPAWDAQFAELWELRETEDGWRPAVRLASWEAMPVSLAQDSESADVVADLVDVGDGTSEADYAGKDVRGKLVLAGSQPGPVAALAVVRFGAVGIVSYAQNQRTAWWREDESLVRWGHLDSFAAKPTFGFMVSLKQARAFQQRLAAGQRVRLHARVEAGRHDGSYEIVTAVIPAAAESAAAGEIAFSCHLDHQRPGANDNASGCATILEVARALTKLIREGRIAPPDRTLRFIWPPEIEGTTILLNARPDLAASIRAVIHLDMVGGGPGTGAVFHVTRSPTSLPTFVNDVAEAFGQFVNRQSDALASGEDPPYPLVAPEGGKEALQAQMVEYSAGSDHDVYIDSSFGIPAIYLNDWPDRYIHTNLDRPDNIDPTKLVRAGFIAAASGYFLATMGADQVPDVLALLQRQALHRTARMLERRRDLTDAEAGVLTRQHWAHERELLRSIESLAPLPATLHGTTGWFLTDLQRVTGDGGASAAPAGDGARVFARNPAIRGPMSVFGYDYFTDHYGSERAGQIELLSFAGARGSGGMYAFEVLNFTDGRRTAAEIRDAVSAEFGPVPLALVVEYLQALKSIGVLTEESD